MKKEEEDKKPAKRITKPSDKTPKKIKEQKNALISKGGMDEKKPSMGDLNDDGVEEARMDMDIATAAEQPAAAAEVVGVMGRVKNDTLNNKGEAFP